METKSFSKKPTAPSTCPCCGGALNVARLECADCGVSIKGSFGQSRAKSGLLALDETELEFAELFLRCGGNTREVQYTLGQSYPTVKKQLDRVVARLNGTDDESVSAAREAALNAAEDEIHVINAMQAGKINVDEAVAQIKRAKAAANRK